mgnify:FL=1
MSNEDTPFYMLPDRTMFYRNCPTCQGLMEYDHKGTRNRANRHGSSCQSCSLLKAWAKRKSGGSDSSLLKEDD